MPAVEIIHPEDHDVVTNPDGDDEMAEDVATDVVPKEIHQQDLSRIKAAGVLHHEHVNVYSKILDLQAEERRGLVSLKQSLGVREVTSQSGQTGIPLAGGKAS